MVQHSNTPLVSLRYVVLLEQQLQSILGVLNRHWLKTHCAKHVGTAAQLSGALSGCAELLPRVRPRRPPRPISFSDGPQQQRKSARMMHPGGSVNFLQLSPCHKFACVLCAWFADMVLLQMHHKGTGSASISKHFVCMAGSA